MTKDQFHRAMIAQAALLPTEKPREVVAFVMVYRVAPRADWLTLEALKSWAERHTN